MDGTPRTKMSGRSRIAGTLVIASMALTILCLGLLELQVRDVLSNSLTDYVGLSAGLGLAALHQLQSAMFNHAVFFSWAYKILVLFSAFGMMATGLALSRKKTTELDRRS